MINAELKHAVMRDMVLLSLIGVKVVLVHGGGPEISQMLKRVGKASVFVDGLRVTDEETAEIVQMVLAGKINKGLVAQLDNLGGRAMGICGMDGGLIQAEMLDERLGYVGRIKEVHPQPLFDLLEKGYIPVVSSIGCDASGHVYNINCRYGRAGSGRQLARGKPDFHTDIPGILLDPSDPSTLIRKVDLVQAQRLVDDGIITGGMIPKVACCMDAIKAGVKKVFVIDGRIPHAILVETLTDEGIGTMFVKEDVS